MAERKATNKYYPPDWDPSKGSINTYVGQHPLRDRARKLDQGILIVRFELPYNIWCEGCGNHVGMGVRYNAEKKKAGMYYTTPIWSFRMKCHLCSSWIEIHTDPKNAEYVIISGARRREERYDPEDIGLPALTYETNDASLANTADAAFSRLEKSTNDERKATEASRYLTKLKQLNDRNWQDPYTLSQTMRRKFRTDKKERKVVEDEGLAIAEKNSLMLTILPASTEDEAIAKQIDWGPSPLTIAKKKELIHNGSIFSTSKSSQPRTSIPNTPAARKVLSALRSKSRSQHDPFAVTLSRAPFSLPSSGPSTSFPPRISGPSSQVPSTPGPLATAVVKKRKLSEGLESPTKMQATSVDATGLVCGAYGDTSDDD